jgi:hypothetical protein
VPLGARSGTGKERRDMATRKQAKAARSNVQKAQQSAYYTSLAEAGQTQNLESPDTPA